MRYKSFPRRNELVVGTVKKVEDHGVIVELDEYDGLEAYIPRSHVASGRIKDIRDFVKEGDKIVGRVIRANRKLGQVDLSLRYVSEEQRKRKLEEWKERIRVLSLLKLAAQRAGYDDPEEVAKEAWSRLYEYYRNPMDALEDVFYEGTEPLTKAGIDEKLAKTLESIAKVQLKPPIYVKNVVVRLVSFARDGILRVKKALLKGLSTPKTEDVAVDIYTAGAPRYVISVRSQDPKLVRRISTYIIKAIGKEVGETEVFEVIEEREYRKRLS
ncbi:MAG: S1 RNA-binding domain-containing protein [Candidatus Korarchaeota archaeon]|nr:S1 RNA-binding domain-containing protein [Candidatus Korarchaeota archaeon]